MIYRIIHLSPSASPSLPPPLSLPRRRQDKRLNHHSNKHTIGLSSCSETAKKPLKLNQARKTIQYIKKVKVMVNMAVRVNPQASQAKPKQYKRPKILTIFQSWFSSETNHICMLKPSLQTLLKRYLKGRIPISI